ncbi:transcriptional regulator [Adhaeribacter terreus]|uniref:Transcriptional regulator n=1 Tax=Adhaeribacter terreus TaxID=529703 RepID=A0ABW0E9F6_9BACT
MALLVNNDLVEFNFLKETLQLSYGSLSTHCINLEKAGYLLVEKRFVGRKPNTRFAATNLGRKAFQDHLDALVKLKEL